MSTLQHKPKGFIFTLLQIVTPRNRMGNSFSRIKCFDADEGIVIFHVLQKWCTGYIDIMIFSF